MINMNNTGSIDSTRYTHQSVVSGVGMPNASAVLEIIPFLVTDAATEFACIVETTGSSNFMSNNVSPPLAGNVTIHQVITLVDEVTMITFT